MEISKNEISEVAKRLLTRSLPYPEVKEGDLVKIVDFMITEINGTKFVSVVIETTTGRNFVTSFSKFINDANIVAFSPNATIIGEFAKTLVGKTVKVCAIEPLPDGTTPSFVKAKKVLIRPV